MDVTYELTRQDVAKAVFWRAALQRRTWIVAILVIVLPVAVVALLQNERSFWPTVWALADVLPWIAGLYLAIGLVLPPVVVLISKLPPGVLGPHQLRVTDDGVEHEAPVAATRLAWEGVYAVERVPGYVLILLNRSLFWAVPEGAIGDPAAVKAFVSDAKMRVEGRDPASVF